jgi:hypothetical protein
VCISDRSSWWDHQVDPSCQLPSHRPPAINCQPSATGHLPRSFSIPLFIFAFVPSSICDLQMISQPVGSFCHTFRHIFSTATFRDLQGFRIQQNPFVIFTLLLVRLFVIKNLENRSCSSSSSGQLLSELHPGLSEAGIRTPMSSTVYLKLL